MGPDPSSSSAAAPEISVVTITYNEAENIVRLLEAIDAALASRSHEILVVDDASPDGTADLVRAYAEKHPHVRCIFRARERGIGSAYGRGVDESRGGVIVTMDADFSHPPEKILDLAAWARAGYVVVGSRYRGGLSFRTYWYRLLGTSALNLWLRVFLAIGVRDHTNGFMAFSRERVRAIREAAREQGLEPFEKILYGIRILAFARRLAIPCWEVPAPYVFRTHGLTKISFLRGLRLLGEEILDSFRIRLGVRGTPRPDRPPAPPEKGAKMHP